MGMFNKGGGRDDGAFEMRRDGPLLKYGAVAVGVIILLFALSAFLLRVTRIEAGHVGVEINLAGKQRGASEIPVRTGGVVYSPLSTQIIEFPDVRADGEMDQRYERRTSGE